MSAWRRLLGWELGAGVGLLVACLAFEAGRGWQAVRDFATHVDVRVAAEQLAGLHCLVGRTGR